MFNSPFDMITSKEEISSELELGMVMRMEKVSQTSYYHLFDQIGSIHEGSEYMNSIQDRDKYNNLESTAVD